MTRTVDLATVVREFVESRIRELRVAIPVVVEAYDAEKQLVDVAVQVQERIVDDDGTVTFETPAVLPGIPVAFPRANRFFISFPIAKGDTGLVIVCDRSIDQWRAKGREAPGVDQRHHDLSDAVFVPGLAPTGSELANASPTDLVIGDDQGTRISIKTSGDVIIGDESAAKAVALAEQTEADIQAIKDAISNAVPAPMDGGATLQTSIVTALAQVPSSHGAAKTKVE